MVLLVNALESGTSGTTVTTSNSGGDPTDIAFDFVNTPNSSTATFDNTHSAHGVQSLALGTGPSSANSNVGWSSSLTLTSLNQVWFRCYVYLSALPTAGSMRIFAAFSSSGICAAINIRTTGKLTFNDANFATQLTSTNGMPTNSWFRVEGYVTASATVGQGEFKLFGVNTQSMDSSTPDETKTSGATLNTAANITKVELGQSGSAPQANFTFWMDDLGVSDSGYIGTAGPQDTETGGLDDEHVIGVADMAAHA